jgi:PIN domain nuclease of toxin-antitoxin system
VTLLVDTHVLLWWLLGSGPLTPMQRAAIERTEQKHEPLGVASITLWEIAKLVELERVKLHLAADAFLDEIEAHAHIAVLPLTARVALESTRLGPRFHRDPADQIIAATARVYGLRLVTLDQRIRDSGVVPVV